MGVFNSSPCALGFFSVLFPVGAVEPVLWTLHVSREISDLLLSVRELPDLPVVLHPSSSFFFFFSSFPAF